MNRISNGTRALVAVLGLVALAAAPAAFAQESAPREAGLGFQGIGARIGFVDPEGSSSTLGLGVHIDAGQIVKGVHLVPLVEYWSVGTSAFGVNIDRSDLAFGGDVVVDFPMQDSRIFPYAGGGLGIHFLGADSNVPGADNDTRSKLGLNIHGGIRNDIMPNISLFGEARYNFVEDANQLKILGGFTYRFIY